MNMSNECVDLSYLLEYTDGDEEAIDELIEIFQETVAESIEDFRKSIDPIDNDLWKAAAHKLKGTSGYVGAVKLRALCIEAEGISEPSSAIYQEFL